MVLIASGVGQYPLDTHFIHSRDNGSFTEIPFGLGRFFRKDMAFISFIPFKFSSSGELESLGGPPVGFHLGHLD